MKSLKQIETEFEKRMTLDQRFLWAEWIINQAEKKIIICLNPSYFFYLQLKKSRILGTKS